MIRRQRIKRSSPKSEPEPIPEPSEQPNPEDQTPEPEPKQPSPKQSKRISTADLTRKLELTNLGLDDNYFSGFEAHNIKDTLYPINGVCYFVGAKGSGKTYSLSAVIQHALRAKEITRIVYIFADNVDTTLIRAIPREYLLSVPKELASLFLEKFLRKKTKFTSCYNLLYSAKNLKYDDNEDIYKTQPIKQCPFYVDNLLEQLAAQKRFTTTLQLLTYANKTCKKYMRETVLTFDLPNGGVRKYNLGPFRIDQYDFICIDDIGQFLDLFGSTRRESPVYKYFTITRQNKTCIYLTGQEIKQLPKMMREMLGAIVLLNGTNPDELGDLKIPKQFIKVFHEILNKMGKYEGILYNFNDKEYEYIRYKQ